MGEKRQLPGVYFDLLPLSKKQTPQTPKACSLCSGKPPTTRQCSSVTALSGAAGKHSHILINAQEKLYIAPTCNHGHPGH